MVDKIRKIDTINIPLKTDWKNQKWNSSDVLSESRHLQAWKSSSVMLRKKIHAKDLHKAPC